MSGTMQEAETEPEDPPELRELRHEIGNALTAASAHLQLLARRLPAWADPRDQQALLGIQDALLRAGRLAKPPGAGLPQSVCDLGTLVSLALSQVPPERADDVVVRARTEPLTLGVGRPEQVVQVLANLLDNALKYSLPGSPIEVETGRYGDWAGDWALIVVRDQGIGIDGEATKTVFAGYRTMAARRTAPGSGLGLQLSRRYVEAQGGELWATGMPGSGCAFYIRLPLARPDPERLPSTDWLRGRVGVNKGGALVESLLPQVAHTADELKQVAGPV
jgi:two-component system, OmpR family, sensor histidine kinase MprB